MHDGYVGPIRSCSNILLGFLLFCLGNDRCALYSTREKPPMTYVLGYVGTGLISKPSGGMVGIGWLAEAPDSFLTSFWSPTYLLGGITRLASLRLLRMAFFFFNRDARRFPFTKCSTQADA